MSMPRNRTDHVSDIVAFWVGGPLTHYEHLSLRSFAAREYPVNLYTYEPDLDPPLGVTLQDARDVLPLAGLAEALIERRAFALLSDIIRYRLLASGPTGRTWIDADVVLLADRLPDEPYLFAWQDPALINGAVLRIPSGSPLLTGLLDAVDGLDADEAVAAGWGTFGPQLITRMAAEHGLSARAQLPGSLYPIYYRQTWRMFDPGSAEWCARATDGAFAIHLWNEIIRRAGLREVRPPDGSFLAQLFARNGIDAPATSVSRRDLRRWAADIDAEQRSALYRIRRRARKRAKRSMRRLRSALRPIKRILRR